MQLLPSQSKVTELYRSWSGSDPLGVVPIQADGSCRRYYRLLGAGNSVIGAYYDVHQENEAFISFSKHFAKRGLPVPKILAEDLDRNVYLEEDLGDTTLFSLLNARRSKNGELPQDVYELYRKIVKTLAHFQITAGKDLDYSVCYPRKAFDERSMMWDLNYFKYYFLKLADVPFHEEALEDDFRKFVQFLLQADRSFFLYRDFQSRNIMIRNGEPFFIDYQGGRRGALQYDIASLMYDGKASLPYAMREELLEEYLSEVSSILSPFDPEEFEKHYFGYVFIRLMQAMGAYGFRGFYQQRQHFLKSVPFVIENLTYLFSKTTILGQFPELESSLHSITESKFLSQFGKSSPILTVRIQSFAYKRGIPRDTTGNGGGFVFDCRHLVNPKRIDARFECLDGRHPDVAACMERQQEASIFLEMASGIVSRSIRNYQERKFTDLSISFGCTGGQHRSVYCAEWLARRIRDTFSIEVIITHRELG